ncbi:hypothetical protein V8C42DRAFT_357711 [Trichoderma barbatum]
MFTNFGFVNVMVVAVRLFWFRKHLNRLAPDLLRRHRRDSSTADIGQDPETATPSHGLRTEDTTAVASGKDVTPPSKAAEETSPADGDGTTPGLNPPQRITFNPSTKHPKNNAVLYIPPPQDRDCGHPLVEKTKPDESDDDDDDDDDDDVKDTDDLDIRDVAGSSFSNALAGSSARRRRRHRPRSDVPRMTAARSMEVVANVATAMFVLGSEPTRERRLSMASHQPPAMNELPFLSRQATVGRNSQFHNLTSHDPNSKYTEYLRSIDQDKNWWAFYSAQTMVDNLGFTLTPDSMISFRDTTFPMLLMSFLAFAGNTLYPVFLRLLSLLIMMYIAIFPIAISIRASNTYEEKSLGIWEEEGSLNEDNGVSYLMTHFKNQLNFDLWYIFLGTFIICIAESDRIADTNEPVTTPVYPMWPRRRLV